MRTRYTALVATFALGFFGCASAPRTPAVSDDPEIKAALSDSTWAPFTDYLTRLATSIQLKWYYILNESRASPRRGSQVVVHFKLKSSGEIEIVSIEDEDCGKQGVLAAISAMETSGPHPKWTDEMIAELGSEQTLEFAFMYQ